MGCCRRGLLAPPDNRLAPGAVLGVGFLTAPGWGGRDKLRAYGSAGTAAALVAFASSSRPVRSSPFKCGVADIN